VLGVVVFIKEGNKKQVERLIAAPLMKLVPMTYRRKRAMMWFVIFQKRFFFSSNEPLF
jgi:hypothetical protein